MPGSPTGLTPEELAPLSDVDLGALAAWHATKAGDDNGRPWWPAAIRRLPLEQRLDLASDPRADAAWEERERRRVKADPHYFTEAYGHVQEEEGAAMPFALWDEQRGVLAQMVERLRLIILKARQLGLTWLALHYAVWLLAFNDATPNAKVLALSKRGDDATKLLLRARRIIALLPPFLRPVEHRDTERSLTKLRLVNGGMMESLAGNPDAARMETVTLAILDEFAFILHRKARRTWTAVLGTLGRTSQVFVISTGNGPAEVDGDGQAFATLWANARAGAYDDAGGGQLHPIFLPSSTHPDRDEAWRTAKRAEFLTDKDFEAEYPEVEDEALAGETGTKVYSPAGISAAEALGRELDRQLAEGTIADPAGEGIVVTWDWGEFTGGLAIWPLEGGGLYVLPMEHFGGGHIGQTVEDSTRALLTNVADFVQFESEDEDDDRPWPLIGRVAYDSAGVESMRTFVAVVKKDPRLLSMFAWRPVGKRKRLPVQRVRFNDYKDETKDYLRWLFKRTGEGETVGVIAISPTNRETLRQLRGLELVEDGRIKKGDDHLPDALIAGAADTAATHRGRAIPEDVDLDNEAPAPARKPGRRAA